MTDSLSPLGLQVGLKGLGLRLEGAGFRAGGLGGLGCGLRVQGLHTGSYPTPYVA